MSYLPPEGGPTSADRVLRMLHLDDGERDAVADVVDAVNSLVSAFVTPHPDDGWAPHHAHGATMLAARLYRRKDTPAGVLSFGLEGAAYVQRNDPDVALLLGMGAYAPPRVG